MKQAFCQDGVMSQQRAGITRLQAEHHAAGYFELYGGRSAMLSDRMNIPQGTLQRTSGIDRRSTTREMHQVDCVCCAPRRMNRREQQVTPQRIRQIHI